MFAAVISLDSARNASKSQSDDDLMALVRGGSREAMKSLAERHVNRLTSFCAKCVRDSAVAEEIVQESFLRIWFHRGTYRAEGKFVVWLFTTARNLCKNHVRNVTRRGKWLGVAVGAEALERIPSNANQEGALITREQSSQVAHAVENLPLVMREAMVLRFEEGLSYEEIAAIVSAPESTVRSRVHHGLKELRANMFEKEEKR